MSRVYVIGGGAAGMFAAVFAAKNGNEVHIIEKNEKFGKKIYITGKGRCNLTNACDTEGLINSVCRNSKFLYSAFYGYSNEDVIRFFEESGCRTKIERGNRVFPVSDHASDVITALVQRMKKAGVHTHLNTEVKEISRNEDDSWTLLLQEQGLKTKKVATDKLIVATGGLSYPSTGSTGDGIRFAKTLGIEICPTMPSLVPLEIKEDFVKELQGLSLRNVEIKIEKTEPSKGKVKRLYQSFGEMLFTHYGISGPLVLSGSSCVSEEYLKAKQRGEKVSALSVQLDLKPALTLEQLEKRIQRDFENDLNKQFKNAISGLFPAKLIPVMVELSGIPAQKKVHEITREERIGFAELIKKVSMTITGIRGFSEAVITKGGVSVKEINPSTMESKKHPNLYFIGEVLDLDALTGGFNLQIAWSTGHAAGASV